MKIKILASLFLFATTQAGAQEPTILNHMAESLKSSTLAAYSQKLTGDGYTQMHDPAFTQANLRVFSKKSQRGPVVFMLAHCNNQLTGLYTHLSQSENVIVTLDIDKYNYKWVKNAVNKYRKGDITVQKVYDPSVPFSLGSSDTYGAPKNYIYISAKNSCHNDNEETPLAPYFSFSPGSVQECLQILNMKRNEVVIAMAKSAYFEKAKDEATGVVQYAKDDKAVNLQYCQDAVQAFVLMLEKSDGKNLDASLKKEGFKMTQEKTGAQNSFARVYEKDTYNVLLQYYGDVSNEEYRDHAYQLIFARKENPCKK